jgi:hypothetical protein
MWLTHGAISGTKRKRNVCHYKPLPKDIGEDTADLKDVVVEALCYKPEGRGFEAR